MIGNLLYNMSVQIILNHRNGYLWKTLLKSFSSLEEPSQLKVQLTTWLWSSRWEPSSYADSGLCRMLRKTTVLAEDTTSAADTLLRGTRRASSSPSVAEKPSRNCSIGCSTFQKIRCSFHKLPVNVNPAESKCYSVIKCLYIFSTILTRPLKRFWKFQIWTWCWNATIFQIDSWTIDILWFTY